MATNRTRRMTPELRLVRLHRQHASLDEELAELEGRIYLTPSEEMRRREIKKQKLAAKDAMVVLEEATVPVTAGPRNTDE